METVGNACRVLWRIRKSENEHSQSISIPMEKIAFVTKTVSGARNVRGFSFVLRTEKWPLFAANRHSIYVNESSLISKV